MTSAVTSSSSSSSAPVSSSQRSLDRKLSSDSMSSGSERRAGTKKECRRIVSAFGSDVIPTSVYGDNFFLPATVIMENSQGACDYRSTLKQPVSSPATSSSTTTSF